MCRVELIDPLTVRADVEQRLLEWRSLIQDRKTNALRPDNPCGLVRFANGDACRSEFPDVPYAASSTSAAVMKSKAGRIASAASKLATATSSAISRGLARQFDAVSQVGSGRFAAELARYARQTGVIRQGRIRWCDTSSGDPSRMAVARVVTPGAELLLYVSSARRKEVAACWTRRLHVSVSKNSRFAFRKPLHVSVGESACASSPTATLHSFLTEKRGILFPSMARALHAHNLR